MGGRGGGGGERWEACKVLKENRGLSKRHLFWTVGEFFEGKMAFVVEKYSLKGREERGRGVPRGHIE